MSGKEVRWAWFTVWIDLCLALQIGAVALGSVQDSMDVVARNHPFLGPPVEPMATIPGGYQRRYEGGTVYYDDANPNTASEVHGEILAKYLLSGGPSGPLGFPRTNEMAGAHGVGRYNHFTNGSIYGFPLLGACIVSGAIREKWTELGAEGGPLGYPTSDTEDLGSAGVLGRFQHGLIHSLPGRGAHYLYGPLLQKWVDSGAEHGLYGSPLEDPYTIEDKWYQRCEHGTLAVDGRSRDLCAEIARRGIGIRDQGDSRGTCVVFTMTFLLEYAYTEMLGGDFADLSEEYLNHVANVAVGRTDAAYDFSVVAAGYHNFGMIPESGMIYNLKPIDFNAVTITAPMYDEGTLLLQNGLRLRGRFLVPRGEEGATQEQFDSILSYLARGIPVGIGRNFHYRSTTGFHCMPAVGYKYDPAWDGGGYVIFKDSHGPADPYLRHPFAMVRDSVIEAYVYEQPYQVDWTPPGEIAAQWKLDEGAGATAADATGAGHTGVLRGGPTWTTGMRGGALKLDGKDDYVDFGDPRDLPSGKAVRSLCAWARTDVAAAGSRWIAAYGTGHEGQAMCIGMIGSSLCAGGYVDDLSVDDFWTPGVWHHVCLTYDGTTARLYADGRQVAASPKTWNLVPNRAHIGRQVDDAPEFWAGSIDDVRIYRRALPQNDIQAILDGKPVPDYSAIIVEP